MFYWSQIPLVKIIIPFCFGILLHQYFPDFFFHQLDFFIITISFILLLFLHSTILQKYKLRYYFGALLSITFLFFGFKIHEHFNQEAKYVQEFNTENVKWLGQISEFVKNDGETAMIQAKVIVVEDSINRIQNAQIWIRKPYTNIQVGDSILGYSVLSKIEGSKIPNQFNYSSFLANRKIYLQGFSDSIILISRHESVFSYATEMRNKIIEMYKEMGIKDQNLAVLIALTLGEKQFLDAETKSTFADAGAMHILAVSGLHVGIIFLILQTLLSFIEKIKFGAIIKAILLLFGIWCFALLTGLSPSVQRAACMFSILAVGSALNRSTNIINSISASAFIILLINPNALLEVGFQLSYSAVIGIVLLHPILQHFFPVSNKWIKKVVALLLVSFSAQVATLPFTLYYFHQFPNWFWLINLGVIPLAFLIVGISVLALLIFVIFSNTFGLSLLLNGVLYLLNHLVELSQILPYSTTSGIWIDLLSALLIFALIFIFTLYLYFPNPTKLGLVLIISIILSIKGISWNQKRNKQHFFAAYPFGNNAVIANIKGQYAELFQIKDTLTEFQKLQIENHLSSIGVTKIQENSMAFQNNEEYKVLALKDKLVFCGDLEPISKDSTNPFDVSIILTNRTYASVCESIGMSSNTFFVPYLLNSWSLADCDKSPNSLHGYMEFH